MNKKDGKAGIVLLLLTVIIVLVIILYMSLTGRISLKEDSNIDGNNEIIEKNENKQEEDNQEISNSKIMELYEEKLLGQDRYALSDIDGNGIVDLITYKEDMSSDKIIANYIFYTYSNGEIIEIGKITGRIDNNILYKMKDNTLLVVYGHMGYEIKTLYKIEKEKLVKVNSEENEIPVGENYATGDEIIPFDFTTDKIQFENYR